MMTSCVKTCHSGVWMIKSRSDIKVLLSEDVVIFHKVATVTKVLQGSAVIWSSSEFDYILAAEQAHRR